MNTKNQLPLSISTLLTLGLSLAAHATPTTYVWDSKDGDPEGIAGTIILDTSSSADGSSSDIISMTFSDKYTTFDAPLSPYTLRNDSADDSDRQFDWSPNQILDMYLGDVQTYGLHTLYATVMAEPGSPDNGGNELLLGDLPNGASVIDTDGTWVAASAPDTANSSLLLLVSASLLLAARRITPAEPMRQQLISRAAK